MELKPADALMLAEAKPMTDERLAALRASVARRLPASRIAWTDLADALDEIDRLLVIEKAARAVVINYRNAADASNDMDDATWLATFDTIADLGVAVGIPAPTE